MFKEFKKFIDRGNVLDLAVGLIIGGVDFSSLSITFRDTKIMYGAFIQSVIDFLIVAFCLFLIVKAINKLTHKKEEEKPKAPAKSAELKTLEEIRDLLKNDVQSK